MLVLKYFSHMINLFFFLQNEMTKPTDTFCGFKKGFLLDTTPKKKNGDSGKKTEKDRNQSASRKIQELHVKGTKEDQKNVIPEVQEALKSQIPILQSTGNYYGYGIKCRDVLVNSCY